LCCKIKITRFADEATTLRPCRRVVLSNEMVRAEGWSYWDADSDEETPPEFGLSAATAYGYDVSAQRTAPLPVQYSFKP